MFIEEIARFSEKLTDGRFFIVCLQCLTRWRAHLLMGICGLPNGSKVRFERLSFFTKGADLRQIYPLFRYPA